MAAREGRSVVSPETRWALERIAADRTRAGLSAETFDVRASRASLPPTDLPMPQGTEVEFVLAGGVPCYWVSAPGTDPDRRIVYFHGGGYVTGDFHSHRSLAGALALAAGAAVLFVEYRRAPEHRFPAWIEDGWSALSYVRQQGPRRRATAASTMVIGGDSAGGAIALAMLVKSRDAGGRQPDAGFSLCGMLNADERTSPFLQASQRSRDTIRLAVASLDDLADPLLSPVSADLRGLPPLLIQTGSEDYCRADSAMLAERATHQGVDVALETWPGMFHVWQRFAPKLPEANDSLARVAAWIAEKTLPNAKIE
jgi:epsilon-lactone hydrolase